MYGWRFTESRSGVCDTESVSQITMTDTLFYKNNTIRGNGIPFFFFWSRLKLTALIKEMSINLIFVVSTYFFPFIKTIAHLSENKVSQSIV